MQSIKSVAQAGEIALVGMLDPTPERMSLIDFFLSQSFEHFASGQHFGKVVITH